MQIRTSWNSPPPGENSCRSSPQLCQFKLPKTFSYILSFMTDKLFFWFQIYWFTFSLPFRILENILSSKEEFSIKFDEPKRQKCRNLCVSRANLFWPSLYGYTSWHSACLIIRLWKHFRWKNICTTTFERNEIYLFHVFVALFLFRR